MTLPSILWWLPQSELSLLLLNPLSNRLINLRTSTVIMSLRAHDLEVDRSPSSASCSLCNMEHDTSILEDLSPPLKWRMSNVSHRGVILAFPMAGALRKYLCSSTLTSCPHYSNGLSLIVQLSPVTHSLECHQGTCNVIQLPGNCPLKDFSCPWRTVLVPQQDV